MARDGIVVIENFYSHDYCEQNIDDIDKALIEKADGVWVDEFDSDHRVFGMEMFSLGSRKFADDIQIKNHSIDYLGYESQASFVLGAKLLTSHGNEGSGGGWHRDNAIFRQFKAIVYLTDVKVENGPFEYVLGSHKLKYRFKYFFNKNKFYQTRFDNDNDNEVSNVGNEIRTVCGGKGTLVLVDTKGIHRGRPIVEGKRYALTKYMWIDVIPKHIRKLLIA